MTTEQRFKRLERQNAKMKAAVAGMAVVLAVVLLVGAGQDQDKPKVLEEVRARRFVVVDRSGDSRCELGVIIAETAMGDKVACPHISLFDSRKNKKVILALSEGSIPSLHFIHKEKHSRIHLGLHQNGLPFLHLNGKTTNGGMNIGLSEGNLPYLLISDSSCLVRACLELSKDESPKFIIFDKDGKVIFKAPE